jgi:MFS family permease
MINISALTAVAGGIILMFANSEILLVLSMIFIGLGLAAGFPVVLGFVGNRYAKWSGTAFGIALTIALSGNMLINYLIGVFTQGWGMQVYPVIMIVTGVASIAMILLVLGKYKNIN